MEKFISTVVRTDNTLVTIAHGLSAAPDEYTVTPLSVSGMLLQGVPGATNLVLSAVTGGATALVTATVNKTVVR